jgi:hypothetical protein
MSADTEGLAKWLSILESVPSHLRSAFVEAMKRFVNGEWPEDALIKMQIELGKTPASARRNVRAIRNDPAVRKWFGEARS